MAADSDLVLAGVAGPSVAPGHALVVLTAESLPTGLFTWRTETWAALLITGVPPTVPHLLTLGLTGQGLGTLNLLSLGSTPAPLLPQLQAGGTVPPVAPLSTVVSPAGEQLTTGVATRGGGLGAGEPEAGLPTGAEPFQGEGAGGTLSRRVAYHVTGVVPAGQKLPTRSSTLVGRTGAGPGTPCLPTVTALYAGLLTRRTLSPVANLPTLVNPAAKDLLAPPTTPPGCRVTAPHLGRAGATVAGGGDRDGTGGAGAGMTEEETFVTTATQGLPAQLSAAMGSLPRVKLGISLLTTVTSVMLGDLTGGLAGPALRTGPADRLLLLSSVRIILQLLFQEEYRVLGPSLDAGQVETVVAAVTAVDGVRPLHGGDADETDGGVERVLESLHHPGHHLALDPIVLAQEARDELRLVFLVLPGLRVRVAHQIFLLLSCQMSFQIILDLLTGVLE